MDNIKYIDLEKELDVYKKFSAGVWGKDVNNLNYKNLDIYCTGLEREDEHGNSEEINVQISYNLLKLQLDYKFYLIKKELDSTINIKIIDHSEKCLLSNIGLDTFEDSLELDILLKDYKFNIFSDKFQADFLENRYELIDYIKILKGQNIKKHEYFKEIMQ